MRTSSEWKVSETCAGAGELHHLDLPAERSLTVMIPERPAIVLGSSQPTSDVDADFCASAGIDVVRRRSGGGAVYVHPTDVVWVDIVIPSGDPLWSHDVGEAMLWVGELWCTALADAGMDGLSVHKGRLVANDWSKALCFAGAGTGEIFRGEAKVVGISQRRTRHFARFQCSAYRRWNAITMAAAIPMVAHDVDRLGSLAVTVPGGFDVNQLVHALP